MEARRWGAMGPEFQSGFQWLQFSGSDASCTIGGEIFTKIGEHVEPLAIGQSVKRELR